MGIESFALEGVHGHDLVPAGVGFRLAGGDALRSVLLGRGKEPESSVSEDSIYIEDNDFDFLRARF